MPASMTTIGFEWTNTADWTILFQVTDEETGDPVDFADAEIAVMIKDRDGGMRLSASVGAGIEVVTAGMFELRFTSTQMGTLCPGSYMIGGVYRLNGSTSQLFRGTIGIVDGVATI